ncbi:hypothetical protein WR25_18230 [Diploscapter pachys]|uniref:DUF7741 domain-containing protein n=1 Tax=Diploscapter pachys TaxID=2018661 RepID=A0A2A2LE67_9BILA|nr:hypothetical protein WR25_18230 [Diploscapter pachys]
MLWAFLLLLLPNLALSQVLCYSCYANSTTQGQYCTIDDLCYGPACYFRHISTGQWETGCTSSAPSGTGSDIQCSLDGTDSNCYCASSVCNSIANAQTALKTMWGSDPPFNTYSLDLPENNTLKCQECGNVTINETTFNIPCGTSNICRGNYCIMVRGTSPHSYCGTTWDPLNNVEVQCTQSAANEAQKCFCSEHMCNVIMSPQNWTSTEETTTTAPLTTLPTTVAQTVPQAQTTQASQTPATQAPPPTNNNSTGNGTVCKDGQPFTPNEQAVYMGEKMKDIIVNGFGDNAAVDEFVVDANNHICNYSPKDGDSSNSNTGTK